MRLRALPIAVVSAVLGLALGRDADAAGCVPCFFGGVCGEGQEARACPPSHAGCLPDSGILTFALAASDGARQANWVLFAKRRSARSPGRLAGRLKVWSDVADPGLPGFSARRRGGVYWGRPARFDGAIIGDRLTGAARYGAGSTCDFQMVVSWEDGTGVPNSIVCRDRSGAVLVEGVLRVGVIRLRGCRQ